MLYVYVAHTFVSLKFWFPNMTMYLQKRHTHFTFKETRRQTQATFTEKKEKFLANSLCLSLSGSWVTFLYAQISIQQCEVKNQCSNKLLTLQYKNFVTLWCDL